jgi:ubiquinone/menaquinone biosynthesis C-methylase UbiE
MYELVTDHEAWRRDCREMGRLVPGRRLLDVGIGPGTSALEMVCCDPARSLVGVDLSPAMLRRARRNAARVEVPLPLVQADVFRLPFRTGAFDGATGHSFLYLLPDAPAALAEVRRVVRPRGRVAFLEPREGAAPLAPAFTDGVRHGVAMALWRVMSRVHRRYTEEALAALLGACGFEAARTRVVLGGAGVVVDATRA